MKPLAKPNCDWTPRQARRTTAIVEGDAEASEVFSRITSDDPDAVMPPPDSERSLTKQQIELIRKWIDQGAHLPESLVVHSA